jgi:hypothetical protein
VRIVFKIFTGRWVLFMFLSAAPKHFSVNGV